MITHRRKGMDAIEEILYLMKDKPADLIKPVTIIERQLIYTALAAVRFPLHSLTVRSAFQVKTVARVAPDG